MAALASMIVRAGASEPAKSLMTRLRSGGCSPRSWGALRSR